MKKETKWITSYARQKLTEDIVDGVVTEDMDAKSVYEMHEGLYKPFKFMNFKQNIKSCHAAVKRDKGHAQNDAAEIAHDRDLHPPVQTNARGYPRWHGSDAERWLKHDMNLQQHMQMTPKELQNTRDEYKVFPLQVFRDHIHQEKRSRIERPYWKAWYEKRAHEKMYGKPKKKKKDERRRRLQLTNPAVTRCSLPVMMRTA